MIFGNVADRSTLEAMKPELHHHNDFVAQLTAGPAME
jgi:hypothetical protein